MPLRVAQARRNALVQHGGFDGLKDALLVRPPQSPGIHGDEQVGGAELAFVVDALDQAIAVAFDEIDFNAAALGEALIERQVGVVVARGVDVDFLCKRAGGSGKHQTQCESMHDGTSCLNCKCKLFAIVTPLVDECGLGVDCREAGEECFAYQSRQALAAACS